MEYYAHTRDGRPPEDWEPLSKHLHEVAETAKGFASGFGAGEWGRVAGLWHDLGKYGEEFQAYLRTSSGFDADAHRAEATNRVDHSTAGARHAADRRQAAGRLLAYCIAGHHAGLPNSEGEGSGLRARLGKDEVLGQLRAAPAEILGVRLPERGPLPDRRHPFFTFAFFTRMIFSCLVDADFLATEAFMDPGRTRLRPGPGPSPAALLGRLDAHLARLRHASAAAIANPRHGEVLRAREDVLGLCRRKAALPPGFFSLHVPTGGGKTLSSLAFALEHAKGHGLGRVVYAIPFTSIIEQTADVFRAALGDLGDALLEHHSSVDPDDPGRAAARLAAENFDAPLVVTTNVQLFESLFACRPSRCRKLHRLARSVIILDEVQSLPPNLLRPTLAALEELVANYGSTVVLCSATQPAVERREGFPIGLEGVRPIVDEPLALHDTLRRVSVEHAGRLDDAELAGRLRAERRVLCIVNSRRHASALFEALGDPDALHLSASMCAAHRAEVVAEVRRRLDDGRPCRVVSTQVIEAGVDVDFPTVYRAAAGLDSVAQAAGRCNREGRLVDEAGLPRLGRVVVFEFDARAYPTSPPIARAADRFREVAPDHRADLLAPPAVEHFFRLHYWDQGGSGGEGWDRGLDRASVMACFQGSGSREHFQFREAAEAYRLIDDAQTPLVVPHGPRGRELIQMLEAMPEAPEPWQLRRFDRSAQRYTVGVYEQGLRQLVANGVLLERHGRIYLGNPQAYHDATGLRPDVLGLDPDRFIL